MALVEGSRTVEIDAPIEAVWAIAADVEQAPQWQGSMVEAEVLERDAEGRQVLVRTANDAKIRRIGARLRFSYDEPRGMRWTQEQGDMKSVDGSWTFEDLGGGRTRATYAMTGDPGRLGLLVRGPIVDRVREKLVDEAALGLKARAEGG